jgi:alpha-galactosidase
MPQETTSPARDGHDGVTVLEPVDHLIHLSASGVSVLIDLSDGRLPSIAHWGAALGAVSATEAAGIVAATIEPIAPNAANRPIRLAILPEHFTGWTGHPGLAGSRAGESWSPKFHVERARLGPGPSVSDAGSAVVDNSPVVDDSGVRPLIAGGTARLTVEARDEVAGLSLKLEIELVDSGLVRARATLRNDGATYELAELSLAFPLPQRAREILDFAGRWGFERVPQRRALTVGTHLREGRKGRTGADAATILSVGTPSFGFGGGEVWGVHVGFSGNHRHYAERLSTGFQVVGGSELLLPGEVQLASGDEYVGPWIYAAYGSGLDDQAQRFHRYLRARPTHPATERLMTINVWEAVYFDHDLERLADLADRAAALGVERFVLDDGWFRHRRNDTAGLGDWYVDETVWPNGLSPLVDHVRGLGMEFGLWFEPEMVNEDSDLARAHPEWIMQTGDRLPVPSRNQQVLNLGIPEAYDYILSRISSILDEYEIGYIKWDHNRDLVDAGTAPTGVPGVHKQTLAVYRMMDELRSRYPGLEIESCSSGGARVDLGVLERTDRVWVSDCIDPLDRQSMNRWTQQLLPPELLGSHIASRASHTTGRVHDLSFRAGTALFGHLGIEWDLAEATESEASELRAWIELYKARRGVLHTGTVVRMDEADATLWVSGVVSTDRRTALFSLAYVGRSEVSPRGRFTLRGLDPEREYRVRPIFIGEPNGGFVAPVWFGGAADADTPEARYPGIVMSGRALDVAGLQAPASYPDHVILLDLVAVD